MLTAAGPAAAEAYMKKQDAVEQPTPAFVAGVEALCDTGAPNEHKDQALCAVCLQWTCDGPHCHRPDVCDVQS